MSGGVETELERPSSNPETRLAAARYLVRTGNEDLLVILGLAHDPQAKRKPGKGLEARPCPACGRQMPVKGVCRRERKCRENADGGAR